LLPVALQAVATQSARHLSLLAARHLSLLAVTAPKLLVMGAAATTHRTQWWSAPCVRRKTRPRSWLQRAGLLLPLLLLGSM
jgi:hypothetical protein